MRSRFHTAFALVAVSTLMAMPILSAAQESGGVNPRGQDIDDSTGPKVTKENALQLFTKNISREYYVERRRLEELRTSNHPDIIGEAKFQIKNVYVNGSANLRQMINLLNTKSGVYLIGDPGVGKTALMEALAQEKEVLVLKNADLTAGTKYRGSLEDNIKFFLAALQDANNRYTLFIDEAHQMMSNETFISEIKRLMDRGQLKVVMGTTNNEYRQYIEPDQAATRRGHTMTLEKPSVSEVIKQFVVRRPLYKIIYGVDLTYKAIVEAATQTDRLFRGQPLGSRVEQVIEYTMSSAQNDLFGINQKVGSLKDSLAYKQAHLDGVKRDLKAATQRRNQLDTLALLDEEEALENEISDLLKQYENALKQHDNEARADAVSQESSGRAGKGPQLRIDRKDEVVKRILAEEDVIEYTAKLAQKVKSEINFAQKLKEAQLRVQIATAEIARLDREIVEHTQRELSDKLLNEADIREALAEKFNISQKIMKMSPAERIEQLKTNWHLHIKGQDHILDTIVKKLEARDYGLTAQSKAMVFFISGADDSMVDEISRVINEFYFGKEAAPLRFDMSNFQEEHSDWGFRGSGVGFQGNEKEGAITGPIRRNPFSVFSFKRFESSSRILRNWLSSGFLPGEILTDTKANPVSLQEGITIISSDSFSEWSVKRTEILTTLKRGLLPVDSAQLSEHFGIPVDHTAHIFSNASLTPEQKMVQLDDLILPHVLKSSVQASDSFIQNLDGILVANSLTFEMAQLIARSHLDRVKHSIENKHHIHFEVSDTVIDATATIALRTSSVGHQVIRVSHMIISDEILASFFRSRNNQPFSSGTHLKIDFAPDAEGGKFSLSLNNKELQSYNVKFPKDHVADSLRFGRGDLAKPVDKFDQEAIAERARKDAK